MTRMRNDSSFLATAEFLQGCCELARNAGTRIMQIYQGEFVASLKSDLSPITDADRASHSYLMKALPKLMPDIPIISEEAEALPSHAGSRFWLVDPLDGTKEFVKRSGEFTVNIALIDDGRPVIGVVHAPAIDVTYFAAEGSGAWKSVNGNAETRISVRPADMNALTVVASRDHAGPKVKEMLARLTNCTTRSMGSSLKFCLVAEGEADLYLRDIPTMEWDTAAAQCVVQVAGGRVLQLSGQPLTYGKSGYRNGAIVTVGDPALHWAQLLG